ncbi:(2,3-dihydroxybenzoyl)adenylate synthase [Gynuella sunshinyii]|uniref:Peptide arylation enzyme n=1 Tax=Gynuella sunshinyii YC6258 TaxID=1445510 RepID=A0A0C5VKK1_9GAMM|nr:(2,3-dihydroxybenzoyl)adenylate synthase [Gynuella sunshinyii]AJQ94806.1 peptide arylation enzyme [Gynuella sunshinyii YC6258]
MPIAFTPWPDEFAQRYRDKGYWNDQPLTDILNHGHDDHTAIISADKRYTYSELRYYSQRLARQLLKRGVRHGDTAIIQLPNEADFYVAYFAALYAGIVPVNALFSHNRHELLAYAQQLQPRLLIASSQHPLFTNTTFIQELAAATPDLSTVIIDGGADFAEDLQTLLHEDYTTSEPLPQPTAADQVAFFQLSGGSTGTPKLIPRTHNDYYYSIRRSVELCGVTAATVYLCALPAGHNYPMSSPGALGIFFAGGTVVMAASPDASNCFDLIQQHQVNMTALVPPAVALWLLAAPEHRDQLNSLKLLQVGGAKLSETLARRIPAELGCQLQQVLGMAEGLVNYTRLNDPDELVYSTQGCPMSADDEVRIVDQYGQPVADGEIGELTTRGPYTIRGYYNAPEHNARVFDADGFYHSGDLVRRNDRGYLQVVGRDKDQINRGGEKIAAEEVENLLLKHTAITHVALVAMADDNMGEKSCAFIVLQNGQEVPKPIVLRKYLRGQGIAEYKLPDHFEFIDQLPLTHVGKPDKVRLRAMIEAKQQQPRRDTKAIPEAQQ